MYLKCIFSLFVFFFGCILSLTGMQHVQCTVYVHCTVHTVRSCILNLEGKQCTALVRQNKLRLPVH